MFFHLWMLFCVLYHMHEPVFMCTTFETNSAYKWGCVISCVHEKSPYKCPSCGSNNIRIVNFLKALSSLVVYMTSHVVSTSYSLEFFFSILTLRMFYLIPLCLCCLCTLPDCAQAVQKLPWLHRVQLRYPDCGGPPAIRQGSCERWTRYWKLPLGSSKATKVTKNMM